MGSLGASLTLSTVNRFGNDDAQRLFARQPGHRLPADIQRQARAKLQRVVVAAALADLRVPPSHQLESLRGDRQGQFSIHINDSRSGGDRSHLPVALYARVPSDRQNMTLSVATRLRTHAKANSYVVARQRPEGDMQDDSPGEDGEPIPSGRRTSVRW